MVIIAGKHPLEREREEPSGSIESNYLENTIFGNFKKPKIHFAFLIWMKVTAAGEKWKKFNLSLDKFFLLLEHSARERKSTATWVQIKG